MRRCRVLDRLSHTFIFLVIILSVVSQFLIFNDMFLIKTKGALTPSTGWQYVKQLTVSDTAGVSADYQMKLIVYAGSGTDDPANGVVYCDNHCVNFPNDIRFGTTNDPSTATQLPQWIEDYNTTQATIWVKLPSDGSDTIYMFVGNSGASMYSDGSATFIFFDALDDLTSFNANWTKVSGDNAVLDSTTYDRPCIKLPDTSTATYTEYERTVSLPTTYSFVIHCDMATDVNQYTQYRTKDNANNRIVYHGATRGSYNSHYIYSDARYNYGTYSLNTMLSYNLYIDPVNRKVLKAECSDGSSYTTATSYGTASDIAKITLLAVGSSGTGNGWFSHLYVRKYSSTEPTWSSFGSWTSISTNTPPSVSNPDPPDGSIGVSVSISQISCNISDADGDTMTWSIETSPNIGSASGTSGNGTITCSVSGLQYNTTYTWFVNVSDGTSSTNVTYTFTTEQAPAPTISNPQPQNGSTGVDLSPTLSVNVTSADGSPVTVEFYHDAGDNAITDNKQLYLQQKAVYYNGKTYIVFIDSSGYPAIVEYNQSTGKISQVVEVDTVTITNAHGAPSVAVYNGYIYVSYGDALYDSGYIYVVKSTNAEDISSWNTPYTLSTSANTAYPLLIATSNALFAIYRDGSNGEYWKIRRTTDGSLWSTEKTILDFSPNRPYVYPFVDGSRLYFAISYRDSTSDGQRNLYCIYTDDGDSTWYEVGSTTALTLPINSTDLTPIITSDATEVYGAWVYNNNPYIICESAGYYKLAYWDGTSWQVKTIVADGSGTTTFKGQGASLYMNDTGTIFAYLPIKENGHFNIKEYTSTDSGTTWTKTADITSSTVYDYPYPFVPLNRNDSLSDIKLIFMEDDGGIYAGDRQTWRDLNNLWCWDGESSFLAGTDYIIDAATVSSGSTASIIWHNRSYDSTYRWYVKAYTDNSETNISAIWHFTTISTQVERTWQDIESGWTSFSNTSSWLNIESGWVSFSNQSGWQTIESGWVTFSNISSWESLQSGWMSFSNTSSWDTIQAGWVTFGNLSSWQSIQNGWITFSNTSEWDTLQFGYVLFSNSSLWRDIESGWITFENTSTWSTIQSGWVTFSNISENRTWQNIQQGWVTFGNTSSWAVMESGWTTFENISSWTEIQSGWTTFSNTSSWQTIESGWVTFTASSAIWHTIESGWTTFSNTSTWNQIQSGWVTFSNSSSWSNLQQGWVTFAGSGSWQNVESGWVAFENQSSWNGIESGWVIFNNISSWKDIESGWVTFTGGKAWITLQQGWVSFGNISSWSQIQSGWVTFSIEKRWSTLQEGWVVFYGKVDIIIKDILPENGSTIDTPSPECVFTIQHSEGKKMNYTVYWGVNQSDISTIIASANNVTNGTYHFTYPATIFGKTYWWKIHVDDGNVYEEKLLNFTLDKATVVELSNPMMTIWFFVAIVAIILMIFAIRWQSIILSFIDGAIWFTLGLLVNGISIPYLVQRSGGIEYGSYTIAYSYLSPIFWGVGIVVLIYGIYHLLDILIKRKYGEEFF